MTDWSLNPKDAVALQRELAQKVVIRPLPENFNVLGAADVSYWKAEDRQVALIVTFRWPRLELLETVHVVTPVRFPYIPGLLSFREIPPLLEAYQKLERKPDVFLCDGQGLAHPRKLGLACHLGLELGIPAVGCAKSRLCGEHEPFDLRRGNYTPLTLHGEVVGYVFCSRDGVKPLYISPGHLADLESSRELIQRCLFRYRIPEPLRQAHHRATRLRRELVQSA